LIIIWISNVAYLYIPLVASLLDRIKNSCGIVITAHLDTYPINWQSPAGSNSALDAKTVQEWILLGDPSLVIGGYPFP